MAKREVDVAIIGAGTAGLAAYHAARAHSRNVVLIEGGPYGTTCARTGCMPSKLLIAAADAAHAVREAGVFGVHAEGPRIDGRAVMARLRQHRDRFVGHVVEAVEAFPEDRRVRGFARFIAPHRLAVGEAGDEIEAHRVVIATGSEPMIPGDLEGAGSRLLTSDDLFEIDDLPQSVAVFGAGVVGLELAQALHRLGVRVRLFGLGGLVGPLSDPAVVSYACRCLAGAYPFDADAEVRQVREHDSAVEVTFVEGGRERVERFDRLLAATGRKPLIQGLDLENAGLELGDQGMPVFDRSTMQCGDSHVFIAGDADAALPVLHEAADDGRIAGDNAARFPDVRVHRRRAPLTILFSRPEIALVGDGCEALGEREVDFAIGEVSFEDQGRATVTNHATGLLRVYGEQRSGKFLGAEMIAPDGEHLAHLLAWALQRELTVQEILDLPYYHPTVEEGL
ncbi:MAG TPA: dihydrolipoyl dehydrogenase, partial [Geminicoccaceae bacterium]